MNPVRTPKPYDPDVLEVCRILCGGKPINVPIKVEAYSRGGYCWFNVLEKIQRDGGEFVCGWMINVYRKSHLVAVCHVVWGAPDGQLIDVTPAQLPTLSQENTVFVPDDNLQPFFKHLKDPIIMKDPLRNLKGKPSPNQRVFYFQHRRNWNAMEVDCRKYDMLRLAGKSEDAKQFAYVEALFPYFLQK